MSPNGPDLANLLLDRLAGRLVNRPRAVDGLDVTQIQAAWRIPRMVVKTASG
jgi:hypothetical protein